MNKFPERLKDLRLEKGLSQEKLSALIGYSQPSIARWEKGLQIPNIEIAIDFALFFKVSLDYLVGLEN